MARTLAIKRAFSLAELGDGWQDCYVEYSPLTPRDLLDIKKIDAKALTKDGSVKYMLDFLKAHVRGGKVLVDTDVIDLEKDDLDSMPVETITSFFAQMSGSASDPKVTTPGQPVNSEPSNG